ncbi:hypothetical protein HHK36_023189 [Tetracentron sinense]|uniref:Verticillium wilt resistance-like protein n=1 Tax=Tetracentron sinense TaxID=13715 RepID=A0A834YMN3_TETSI|nr:hypothetical protein HHK36_023189 [Tetracentron sinense]
MSWNSSTDCCLWDGVTCNNHTGRVIGLDLSSSSIVGEINSSSSLFHLGHLQRLNLANNSFNSSLFPSGFGQLFRLTHLNLSITGFKGQVPPDLSRLSRLVSLDISIYFIGVLKLENPDLKTVVGNLSNLRELHLDGVNISMKGVEWCQTLSSALPKLRVLSLSRCNLAGPIHSSLSELRFLSHLSLDTNPLYSPVPDFLANFSSLMSLHLSYCDLYGEFPAKIFSVLNLQTLDATGNPLLVGFLPEFPRGSALQVLKLSRTKFSGRLPASIKNLKFLTHVELSGCGFSGLIPSSIENLTELVHLDLSHNNFDGPIPLLGSSKITDVVLSDNHLTGSIPSSLFTVQSMQKLDLSQNQFTGQLPEFQSESSSLLEIIDLSDNKLEGPIPRWVSEFSDLKKLLLSSNRFTGILELDMFREPKLGMLDLSDNRLSVNTSCSNSTMFRQIYTLRLSSCNISEFPSFLRNQSMLSYLDLSNNKISGQIPNWVWELGNQNLFQLNLSYNMLHGFEKQLPDLSSSGLAILDLHSNLLQGPILIPSSSVLLLDYSNNKFKSIIPPNISNHLVYTISFSVSRNNLTGEIPSSICDLSYLEILDLSDNHLNGTIPKCLGVNGGLRVLNLRRNDIHGTIPSDFGKSCSLNTLTLNGNHLEGPLPGSLVHCKNLEFLDLGNNHIHGPFPFWLEMLPNLRVLILRSNNFHGSIKHPLTDSAFTMLQIIDLSSNNFTGNLPWEWFGSWKAMMKQDKSQLNRIIGFNVSELSGLDYLDSVAVTSKGQDRDLVKILTVFTSIDISNNQFEGAIPEGIGNLKSLHILNFSHNHFTSQIPSSLGNLEQLESLDLSQNKLSGEIPQQLGKLTFLSVLNLSQNLLGGKIPVGSQFQTFTEASFQGNLGLCGFPLSKSCKEDVSPPRPSAYESKVSESTSLVDWNFVWMGCGCGMGIGISIGIIIENLVGNIIINNILFRKNTRRRVHRHIRQL